MAKKQARVPGMHEAKPNREQRRHPDARPADEPLARDERLRPPKDLDVPDPRTKTSGHKKTTADNWNQ